MTEQKLEDSIIDDFLKSLGLWSNYVVISGPQKQRLSFSQFFIDKGGVDGHGGSGPFASAHDSL